MSKNGIPKIITPKTFFKPLRSKDISPPQPNRAHFTSSQASLTETNDPNMNADLFKISNMSSEADYLTGNRPKIGHDKSRKYGSVPHTNKKAITDGIYIQIVKESSQFEHLKSTSDVIFDIFKHTDHKV